MAIIYIELVIKIMKGERYQTKYSFTSSQMQLAYFSAYSLTQEAIGSGGLWVFGSTVAKALLGSSFIPSLFYAFFLAAQSGEFLKCGPMLFPTKSIVQNLHLTISSLILNHYIIYTSANCFLTMPRNFSQTGLCLLMVDVNLSILSLRGSLSSVMNFICR